MVQLAGRKIRQSLGTLIMVQALWTHYSPDAIRLFRAGHHYRQLWEYAPAEVDQAQGSLEPSQSESLVSAYREQRVIARISPRCSRGTAV